MGKLTLTLRGGPGTSPDRGQILTQLRRRGARLIGSHLIGPDDDPAEVFEFTTTAVQRRTSSPVGGRLIGSTALQQERVLRLAAVAQLAIAFRWHPDPTSAPKENCMRKVSARTLVLGTHEPVARKLYDLARRLVRGEGPPEELRLPSPPDTIVPGGTEERPREAWGVGGVGVAIEMRRPYAPIEALVVAGYILFGLDWPARFKTLRLPAALETAYRSLEQHFEERGDASPRGDLVTIPKKRLRPTAQRGSRTSITTDTPVALPPPSRLQLPHEPSGPLTDTDAEGEDQ
jgi:hypothetical protein